MWTSSFIPSKEIPNCSLRMLRRLHRKREIKKSNEKNSLNQKPKLCYLSQGNKENGKRKTSGKGSTNTLQQGLQLAGSLTGLMLSTGSGVVKLLPGFCEKMVIQHSAKILIWKHYSYCQTHTCINARTQAPTNGYGFTKGIGREREREREKEKVSALWLRLWITM